jgi:broad specificity phosphatase PhoE
MGSRPIARAIESVMNCSAVGPSGHSTIDRTSIVAPFLPVVRPRVTKILLIRHGHVEGIKPERFRGRADLALTEHGKAQAELVARRVAWAWRPSAVYTSPMQRCVATAAAIAKACGVASAVLEELADLDYGTWQFTSYEEARVRDPELFAKWFATPHLVRFPDGESLQDLAARAADALRYILVWHVDDTVVLVSHDSFNRVLFTQLLDQSLASYWRLAQDPCCLNEIDLTQGQVRVLRINEAHHLQGLAEG